MNGLERSVRCLLAGIAAALALNVGACADLAGAGYDSGGNPLIQDGVMDQRRGGGARSGR